MKQSDKLQKGDTIGIIAPASYVLKDYIEHTCKIIEQIGFKVKPGKNLYARYNQFAGTDNQRLQDFQEAIDDEQIKAILCARGGYGSIRFIDKVNWSKFSTNPKWICGFSDITVFHQAINNMGIASLHSLMPINIKPGHNAQTPWIKDTFRMLAGKGVSFNTETLVGTIPCEITGKLTGGNLSMLYSILGTPYDYSFDGAILFLEDVGEHHYRIDRMVQSLKLAGKLKNLKAVLLGSFTQMDDSKRPFGKTVEQIVNDACSEYAYPVISGLQSGHQEKNYPLKFGGNIHIVSQKSSVIINWID